MTVLRHWFAWNADGEALILTNERSADDYRAAGGETRGPYVPAEQLEGAVDEIERLRGVIRDMKSLMPIVRRHAEQVTEWANEVLDSPAPGGR